MLPRTPERERSIETLRRRAEEIRGELYANLTPWQRVLVARHSARPNTLDYVDTPVHRLRRAARRPPLRRRPRHRLRPRATTRPAGLHHRPPEGPRHQAEDLPQLRLRAPGGLSQGAARDAAGAEVQPADRRVHRHAGGVPGRRIGGARRRRGHRLQPARDDDAEVPIVVIVCGEGGSGGALGIAIGDRVLMQEFSVYSVIRRKAARRSCGATRTGRSTPPQRSRSPPRICWSSG